MKRSYLFAIILGVAISAELSLFNVKMDTLLWWVIVIVIDIILTITYFKLKIELKFKMK